MMFQSKWTEISSRGLEFPGEILPAGCTNAFSSSLKAAVCVISKDNKRSF